MSEQEPAGEAESTTKTNKHRSPNYPVIGLRRAVERVGKLYSSYKRGWVHLPVAHAQLGYKAMSGVAKQNAAALRAFGLIDLQGDGAKAEMRVSERAYQIILEHPERDRLLRAAALGPGLHLELWKKYAEEGDGLPPDDVLKHYLLFQRGFNPESVDGFVAQFKDTISYAKLESSGKDEGADQGGVGAPPPPSNPSEGSKMTAAPAGNDISTKTPPLTSTPALAGQKDFPSYLTNNQRAVLYVPAKMTQKDYDLLKRQIENHLLVIEATSIADPEASN
jgi:hypothetical protein